MHFGGSKPKLGAIPSGTTHGTSAVAVSPAATAEPSTPKLCQECGKHPRAHYSYCERCWSYLLNDQDER